MSYSFSKESTSKDDLADKVRAAFAEAAAHDRNHAELGAVQDAVLEMIDLLPDGAREHYRATVSGSMSTSACALESIQANITVHAT